MIVCCMIFVYTEKNRIQAQRLHTKYSEQREGDRERERREKSRTFKTIINNNNNNNTLN